MNKKILSLFLLLIMSIVLIIMFSKNNKTIDTSILLKEEFNEMHYEFKKCFLFKKYCFINSPKTYKLLMLKMRNTQYEEDCLKKMKCNLLSQKNKIGISFIEKQSRKLRKFKKIINSNNCKMREKDNMFNYIAYMSLYSSIIERKEKKEIYKNLNLKNNLDKIRLYILNCKEN